MSRRTGPDRFHCSATTDGKSRPGSKRRDRNPNLLVSRDADEFPCGEGGGTSQGFYIFILEFYHLGFNTNSELSCKSKTKNQIQTSLPV